MDKKVSDQNQGRLTALVERLSLDLTDLVAQYRHNLTTLQLVQQQGKALSLMEEELLALQNQLIDYIETDDIQQSMKKKLDDTKNSVTALVSNVQDISSDVEYIMQKENKSAQVLESFQRDIALTKSTLDLLSQSTEQFMNKTTLNLESSDMQLQLQASRSTQLDGEIESIFLALGKVVEVHDSFTANLSSAVADIFQIKNSLLAEKVRLNETEDIVSTLNSSVYNHFDTLPKSTPPSNKFHSFSSVEKEAFADNHSTTVADIMSKFETMEQQFSMLQSKCTDAELKAASISKALIQDWQLDAGSGDGIPPPNTAENIIPVDSLELWKAKVDVTLYDMKEVLTNKLPAIMTNITRLTSSEQTRARQADIKEINTQLANMQFSQGQIQTSIDMLQIAQAQIEISAKQQTGKLEELVTKSHSDQFRLIDLQNKMFNFTLQSCKDVNENLEQNLKIANVEVILLVFCLKLYLNL